MISTSSTLHPDPKVSRPHPVRGTSSQIGRSIHVGDPAGHPPTPVIGGGGSAAGSHPFGFRVPWRAMLSPSLQVPSSSEL